MACVVYDEISNGVNYDIAWLGKMWIVKNTKLKMNSSWYDFCALGICEKLLWRLKPF
jgi:hypothetical protein